MTLFFNKISYQDYTNHLTEICKENKSNLTIEIKTHKLKTKLERNNYFLLSTESKESPFFHTVKTSFEKIISIRPGRKLIKTVFKENPQLKILKADFEIDGTQGLNGYNHLRKTIKLNSNSLLNIYFFIASTDTNSKCSMKKFFYDEIFPEVLAHELTHAARNTPNLKKSTILNMDNLEEEETICGFKTTPEGKIEFTSFSENVFGYLWTKNIRINHKSLAIPENEDLTINDLLFMDSLQVDGVSSLIQEKLKELSNQLNTPQIFHKLKYTKAPKKLLPLSTTFLLGTMKYSLDLLKQGASFHLSDDAGGPFHQFCKLQEDPAVKTAFIVNFLNTLNDTSDFYLKTKNVIHKAALELSKNSRSNGVILFMKEIANRLEKDYQVRGFLDSPLWEELFILDEKGNPCLNGEEEAAAISLIWLEEAGLNPHICDKGGNNALMVFLKMCLKAKPTSLSNRYQDLFFKLIKYSKEDLNHKNNLNETALTLAIDLEDKGAILELVRNGAIIPLELQEQYDRIVNNFNIDVPLYSILTTELENEFFWF